MRLVLLILIIFFNLPAQIWIASFDGSSHGNDGPIAITTDAEGSILIAGYSAYSGLYTDYLILKYDSGGTEQWHDCLRGRENSMNIARGIAVDNSNNVYATGTVGNRLCTSKHSPDGARLWVRYFALPDGGVAHGRAIAIDTTGNAYVTGNALDEFGNANWVTLKYNFSGQVVWTAVYSCSSRLGGAPSGIAVGPQNDIYIAGPFINDSGWALLAIKYNSAGAQQWAVRYPGGRQLCAMCLDDSGNLFLSGQTGQGGYITLKYGPDGRQHWVRRCSSFTAQPWSMLCDHKGNVYVTGWSTMAQGGDYDFCTVKYSPNGTERWIARYNGPDSANDRAFGIGVDSRGNVYVTGSTNADYATVKYDSLGNELWVALYGDLHTSEGATCLAIDLNDYCIVSGYAYTSGRGDDIVTIKYHPDGPVPISENHSINHSHGKRLSFYPNPFHSQLIINRGKNLSPSSPITILSSCGEVIRRISSSAGLVIWDGRDDNGKKASPGVYFLRTEESILGKVLFLPK